MRESKNKKRFQVGLTTVLLALVCVSAYFRIAVALPKIALPALPLAAFVAIVVLMLRHADRILEPCDPAQPLAIGSCVLTSVSLWTIGFVVISELKILWGSFGPVQFAEGDMVAMFVFNLRVVTLLVLVAIPVICSVIGAIRLGMGMRLRPDWLAIGVGSYLLAWIVLFWNPSFIPTV